MWRDVTVVNNDQDRPIRICHLGKFYPPATGGIESHLQTLAHAQSALGAQVQVICVNHQDAQGADVTFQRWATTKTVVDWDGPVQITRVGRQASLARFDMCGKLLPLLGKLLRQPLDILHLHAPNPTMLLALAATPTRCPIVITHHSDVVR
jgi:rhamnosyl/mannosyltransferase